jgi:hypothetical protein
VREIAVFDVGRYVECDICGTDLTDDPRSGGFIFAGKGVGPCCHDRLLTRIEFHGEQEGITAYNTPEMSFADWVRHLRSQHPGGNQIRILTSSPEGTAPTDGEGGNR